MEQQRTSLSFTGRMEQQEATGARQDQLRAARPQPLQLPLRVKFTTDLRGSSISTFWTGRASSIFTSEQYFGAVTAVEHQRRIDFSAAGGQRQWRRTPGLPGLLSHVEGLKDSCLSSNSHQTSGKADNRCSSRNSDENYVSHYHADTEARQPRCVPLSSRQVIGSLRSAHTYGVGSSAGARSLRAVQACLRCSCCQLTTSGKQLCLEQQLYSFFRQLGHV